MEEEEEEEEDGEEGGEEEGNDDEGEHVEVEDFFTIFASGQWPATWPGPALAVGQARRQTAVLAHSIIGSRTIFLVTAPLYTAAAACRGSAPARADGARTAHPWTAT